MKILLTAAISLSLLMSSMAMARDGGHGRPSHRSDRHYSGGSHRGNDYKHFDRGGSRHRDGRYDRDRFKDRSHFNRGYRDHRYDYRGRHFDNRFRHDDRRFYGGRYYRPSGYFHRSWHRGDRLPRSFFASRYVVRDFGRFGLYSPPRGYHWVRVDRDIFLAGVTTGVIIGISSNRYY